jgi:hypothetical protein
MELSSGARALLEAQGAGRAAQAAQATHDARAAEGPGLAKAVDAAAGGRENAGDEAGVSAAATARAAEGSGAATSSRHAGEGEGDVGSGSGRDERGRDLARDTLTRAPDTADAATDVRANGAFGADPRLQSTTKSEATPEARAEQAKAASERILQQIERIAEQRSVGREMVIATERGPVRVRVEIAEKQVSVAFRTEDEQLKNMLRSGLPALQSTLAKRGFAGSEFRFDGDGGNDMMASGGRGKHADARAMRESRLGEVMVESVVAEAADEARRDPKALLSVTA